MPTFVSPITDLFALPHAFGGLSTALDEIWAKLGVASILSDVTGSSLTDLEPDDGTSFTEDESIAMSDEILDEEDIETTTPSDGGADGVTDAFSFDFSRTLALQISAFSEISAALPGLDGVSLVLNPGSFTVNVAILSDVVTVTAELALAVRFDRSLLVPMKATGSTTAPTFEVDQDVTFVQLDIASAGLTITSTGDVSVDAGVGVKLTRPAMIGETGVIIESADIVLNLTGAGDRPDGAPAGWKGVLLEQAKVRVPSVFAGSITATKLGFGSGGVTGAIGGTFPLTFQNGQAAGPLAGGVLGMVGGVTSVNLVFRENVPVAAAIGGQVLLPSFGFDTPLGLTIALAANGVVTATLTDASGAATLDRPGFFALHITSLTVGVDRGAVFTSISGSLTPEVAAISWPTLEIKDLRIDSSGRVSFSGGWVDLPSHKSISLYGFTVEVTKIGFGQESDGHDWIGFSGGVKLVDGFKAGASVDGLRIRWRGSEAATIALDGVSIELDIPNAISLKGSVSLKGQEFGGSVQVTIDAIQLTVGGQFVTGTVNGTRTFAVYLNAELPSGFPLGGTGLGLYGVAGLYAENREPGKLAAEGWYQNPDGSDGWYLRSPRGIDHVDTKWRASPGQRAFGAGVTIGTFGDNGFKFNGKLLLVLIFPGPRVLLEGKANLFKKRAALASDDATFRTLAVIDPGKSVQLSLDAHYAYKTSGELIDMRGSAEAFFASSDDWHIFLGFKDDPKRRISARLFKLFDTWSYFELRPHRLDIGSGWSFDKSWGFSHLKVGLSASFDEAATVSWHPSHFTGQLNLQGKAQLKAFGHGVGVGVSAKVTGDVFDPMHLHGQFHVGIDLPWPLPDVGATVQLDWQPSSPPALPPLPLPLKEVAVEWEPGTTAPPGPRRWPFVRGTNQLPNYEQSDGEAAHGHAPGPDADAGVFANALLVPADAQVSLTFTRPAGDKNNIGNNPVPIQLPPELIGDPYRTAPTDGYRQTYDLVSVTLEKIGGLAPGDSAGTPLPVGLSGAGWVMVAGGGATDPAGQGDQQTTLFGAWLPSAPSDGPPDPSLPVSQQKPADASVSTGVPLLAQSKLLIGAKTPLKYTAISSQSWDDWFTSAYPSYPCLPFDPDEKFVAVFDQPIGTNLGSNPGAYRFPGPIFDVRWTEGGIVMSIVPVEGTNGPNDLIDRGLIVADTAIIDEPLTTSAIQIGVPPGQSQVSIHVTRLPQLDSLPSGYGTFPPPNSDNDQPISNPFGFESGAIMFTGPGAPTRPLHIIRSGSDAGLLFDRGLTLIEPIGDALQIDLFMRPTETIDSAPQGRVTAFDASNGVIGAPQAIDSHTVHLTFFGPGIHRIEVQVDNNPRPGNFVLTKILVRTPVVAVATVNGESPDVGPFVEQNGLIVVTTPESTLDTIYLSTPSGGEFVIVEISIPSRRDEVIRHTVAALAQFDADDPVLEPDTHYRLQIVTRRTTASQSGNVPAGMKGEDDYTESVYFRTARLPGLGVPAQPATDESNVTTTGFEDLTFYLARTVPAVPPPQGGHTSPARAFYRATDVLAEFSPDTIRIQSMYRIGKRDLTIRLFDAKNQPLRDARGRVVLGTTRWGRSDDPRLSAGATRWVGMVSLSSCAPSPPPNGYPILNGEQAAVASSVSLAPLTLHQARLVPMLLREDFEDVRTSQVADGQFELDHWHAEPAGASWQGQSETVIDPGTGLPALDPVTGKPLPKSYFATVATGGETSLVYHGPLASLADVTHANHPSTWTNFRASVQLRWSNGAVGLEFRRGTAGLLRVVFDRTTASQRIESVVGGATQVLSAGDASFPDAAVDVILTVYCENDSVQVFQTLAGETLDAPELVVTGVPTSSGGVALYANNAATPRFTAVRVEDLEADPSTAHRFDFITSSYVNFTHHLGSFDDRTLAPPHLLSETDLGSHIAFAFSTPSSSDPANPVPAGVVPVSEQRAFLELEALAMGAGPPPDPERVEVLRVAADPGMTALLVRSPEPILWERTELAFSAIDAPATVTPPGSLKMTAVTFSSGDPNQETVTILARDAQDPSGCAVEWRPLHGAGDPEPPWTPYFTFGTENPLDEGEQVRVCSGAPDSSLPHDVGVTLRFVGNELTASSPQFPTTGVELRLLAPSGDVVHQRTLYPDSAFVSLAASVVRKGDGTAFFLWVPVTPGASRVQLTFMRAATTTLPAMHQSGSARPERIALDLPSS